MQSCETSVAVESRVENVDTKAVLLRLGAAIHPAKVINEVNETRCFVAPNL